MKKIEAIVRPYAVDDIREVLLEAGFHGMTMTGGQRLWPAKRTF